MKRLLITFLLLTMIAVPAMAKESGYYFEDSALGLRIAIDEEWTDAVKNNKLSFFVRTDDKIKTDGVIGLSMLYITPDLKGYAPKSYEEGQKWLNERAVAVGGVVVTSKKDADISAIYPKFERKPLANEGSAYFTLIRPQAPKTDGLSAKLSALATAVHKALSEKSRYIFSDATIDYGILGAFDTDDIAGNHVNNTLISESKMTVVNFWGTFCGPCIGEMPTLAKLAKDYADKGVSFLGVVTDGQDEETLQSALEITESAGVDYPNIAPIVSSDVMRRIEYIPTTIFLNSKGKMIGDAITGARGEKEYREIIEKRLAKAK